MLNSAQNYNALNGVVNREKLEHLKSALEKDGLVEPFKKINDLLNKHPDAINFDIEVVNPIVLDPKGLNASWHAKKNNLRHKTNEKVQLKKGYKYVKGGEIVKVKQSKKRASKLKPDLANLKSKILKLKDKYGLGHYQDNPLITTGLNGVMLADGHEIYTNDLDLVFGDNEEHGLNASAKDVEAKVNELILDKINTGEKLPPWKKSWATKSNILAQNFDTKKPYSGSNSTILNILLGSIMPTPYYLTFNQVKKLKGTVKKGAKSIPLVYYNFYHKIKDLSSDPAKESKLLSKISGFEIKTKGGKSFRLNKGNYAGTSLNDTQLKILKLEKSELISQGFLKSYWVFNIADTEGIEYDIPTPKEKTKNQKIGLAEAIIDGFIDKPKITNIGDDAVYNSKSDEIKIPVMSKFDPVEEYYTTLFHELIHSTLHKTRLDREKLYEGKDPKSRYAFEELIAELGASYLCGICGILDVVHLNSAAYLKGWHKKLQEATKTNSNFFIVATKETQKAVNYILKGYQDQDPKAPKTESNDLTKAKAKAKAKIEILKLKFKF